MEKERKKKHIRKIKVHITCKATDEHCFIRKEFNKACKLLKDKVYPNLTISMWLDEERYETN